MPHRCLFTPLKRQALPNITDEDDDREHRQAAAGGGGIHHKPTTDRQFASRFNNAFLGGMAFTRTR